MTNTAANRRAWLGQEACFIHCGATEITTRSAWGKLTDHERRLANIVADRHIKSYELRYERKDRELCF